MKKVFTTLAILFLGFAVQAQTNLGINNANPDASAALDVTSTSQGMLVPRMTLAQRNMINMVNGVSTPATGLLIYQTNNTPGFYFYNGTAWTAVGAPNPNSLPNAVTSHTTSATAFYHNLYSTQVANGTGTTLGYFATMYFPVATTINVTTTNLGSTPTTFGLYNVVFSGTLPFTEGTLLSTTTVAAYSGSGAYPTGTLNANIPAGSIITLKAVNSAANMVFFTQTSTQ